MIRIGDMRERLDKRPFEPFRIGMTDGRSYDIAHPDLCMLGRTTVYVGVPDPKLKKIVMRVDQCALLHIVCFEQLDGHKRRANKGKNGRKK